MSASRGSSPLTRGKLRKRLERELWRGLIPAHAGKTSASWSATASSPAHPRSRGENHGQYFGASGVPGSSPLTRGKLEDEVAGARVGGLIPAHAGKTLRSSDEAPNQEAHPRSRGENRRARRVRAHADGLIPAHAGKTSGAASQSSGSRAHPRSRGENVADHADCIIVLGSSPLTRGKPRCTGLASCRSRLIPAHAGKTRR